MKIVDCFIFFNELNLLDFRLQELNSVVDHFIVVESNKTFSNRNKEFVFEKNSELFSQYLDRIVYIKVEDMPTGDNHWDRETHQRNCIYRGLQQLNLHDDDIVIISDLDEVPDSKTLKILKTTGIFSPYSLQQEMYYYNFNCRANLPWTRAKILPRKLVTPDIEYFRKTHFSSLSLRGGWHLSYFGDIEWIISKIQSFSHQEYNNSDYTDPERIKDIISRCDDLFQRDNKNTHDFQYLSLKNNNYLPNNYKILLKNEN